MSIIKTEAIVLSHMPYSETSKIIRVFSKEMGRLSFMAKGSRKLKNRFGASLDPLTLVNLVFYYKEKRDLHTLTQCDIVNPFLRIKSNLDKLSFGFAIAEVVSKLVIEEEENVPLFNLIEQSLECLDSAGKNYDNVFWYFMTRFVKLSGYGFSISDCEECDSEIKKSNAYMSLTDGSIVCSSCARPAMNRKLSPDTVQVLKAIMNKQPDMLANLQVSGNMAKEITDLIESYFKYHFDGFSSIQALKLMN